MHVSKDVTKLQAFRDSGNTILCHRIIDVSQRDYSRKLTRGLVTSESVAEIAGSFRLTWSYMHS